MKFTVVGAGAIGGVLGAYLARGGHDVTFCDVDVDHVKSINQQGLRVEGPDEVFTVSAPAFTPAQLLQKQVALETVFLCVKSQDTDTAIQQLLPLVGASTQVVSCQNGLCETTIANYVGSDRTIGCFVNFSADYLEPGRILYGGVSSLYLGELNNTVSPRILKLQQVLQCWGPVQVTDNIWGYLWGKLSYAAVLFATATVDETMATVIRRMQYREMLMELACEVLDTAERQGIRPEGFDDWLPAMVYPRENRDDIALNEQLERLAKRMSANKKEKSGVWRDLAVRKRKTEVDFQLLPVADIGRKYSVPTPLLNKLIEIVHGLEDGALNMSWANLDAMKSVYDDKLRQARGGTSC